MLPQLLHKLPRPKKEVVDSYIFLKTLVFKYKWIFGVVVSSFFLGLLLALMSSDETKLEFLSEVFAKFSQFSTQQTTLFYEIFWNNLKIALITLVSGFTVVIPPIIIFINGSLVAIVYDFIFRSSSVGIIDKPTIFLLATLLPHGIIELPTMLVATFLSILLGLKMVFNKKIEPQESRMAFLIKIFKTYIFIIIPLLLLAAVLESFLTYTVANNMVLVNKPKDSTIDSVVIQPADIKTLGVEVEEGMLKDLEIEGGSFFVKRIGVYLYDEHNYQVLKRIKPGATNAVSKFYRAGEDTQFIIAVQKFGSEQDTQERINVDIRALDLLRQRYPEFRVEELNYFLYKLNYSGDVSYLVFIGINNYTYSIVYKGDDLEFLLKLVALQAKKIYLQN